MFTVSANPDTEKRTLLSNDQPIIDKEKIYKKESRRKVEPEILKLRKERVVTTDKEHNKLVALKGSEKEVEKYYEEISRWKLREGIEGGDDYKTILKWTIRKKNDTKSFKDSEDIAKKLMDKFPSERNILHGYNYIEFLFGQTVSRVLFSDNAFKEQVINNLRKMNLPIEGL
jgi:hypothetical protein